MIFIWKLESFIHKVGDDNCGSLTMHYSVYLSKYIVFSISYLSIHRHALPLICDLCIEKMDDKVQVRRKLLKGRR